MDTTLLKDTLAQISALWDKQSKPKKYIAIISISIPSYLVLREIYWFLFRKYHSLPPGPNGLPIFGAFFLWTGSSHARINLSKKYGPILYSRILGMPAITISSAKLMRKLFTQRQFLNRATIFDPDNDYYHDMNSTGDSHVMPIIQVNGDSWVKRRKLMQDTLFRVLNRTTAGKLLKEAMTTELSPYLNDIIKSNKPWTDPREILEYITLNTMYCTLFDTKLERNSKLHHAILKDIHDALEHSALSVMVIKTPFMKYFFAKGLDAIKDLRDGNLLKLVLGRAQSTHEEKSYIDYTHDRVMNGEMTQDEEVADMFAVFSAGTDTTSSSLEFGIPLIAKYQNTQDQVRKELFDIMGKEFDLKMVNKCVLLRAVVHEILRIASVVTSGVPHQSFKDYWVTLDDGQKYKIPAGYMVQANVDYIHIYGKDEKWERTNGDEIILENWLIKDENGGMRFKMNESFILFGVGKRDCVGRQLAIKEMLYTVGYLLMNYKVSLWNKEDENVDLLTRKVFNIGLARLDPPPLRVEAL